ncbi:RepA-like replication initiator [Mycobacterium Phage Radiance]|nr:RepA-like replication initiator [Mycobacterium Phage Radiance]
MRIRSIKPEFWRSDDITKLPISTRLTFIGLWSYVDDNGVGADKLVSIVADLYADEFAREPLETLKRVTEDLERLASGGQVTRYKAVHNGSLKDLLYITKWKQHQRVNHPSLGHKYPLPPADMVNTAVSLLSSSGDPHESLTHEQGNRGTGEGEQGSRGAGDEEVPLPPEPPPGPYDSPPVVIDTEPVSIELVNKPSKPQPSSASKTVVRQELGSNTYPRATVDRLAVQVEKLTREGQPDALIREALREWERRPNCNLPEYLPTVLGDVIKSSRSSNLTAGEAKVLGWAGLGNPDQRKAIGQ